MSKMTESYEDKEWVVKGTHASLIIKHPIESLEKEILSILRVHGQIRLSQIWLKCHCHLWEVSLALKRLKEKGLIVAEKRAQRVTREGLIEAYIHTGGRIGSLVELNCETDFVARTEEFIELAHHLAMQVVATDPKLVSPDDAVEEEDPAVEEKDPAETCLLLQPFIKEPEKTIQDIINEVKAKVGENIRVRRFTRFQLGD